MEINIKNIVYRSLSVPILVLSTIPSFTHGVEYFSFETAPAKTKDILNKAKFISFFRADTKTFREGIAEADGEKPVRVENIRVSYFRKVIDPRLITGEDAAIIERASVSKPEAGLGRFGNAAMVVYTEKMEVLAALVAIPGSENIVTIVSPMMIDDDSFQFKRGEDADQWHFWVKDAALHKMIGSPKK